MCLFWGFVSGVGLGFFFENKEQFKDFFFFFLRLKEMFDLDKTN